MSETNNNLRHGFGRIAKTDLRDHKYLLKAPKASSELRYKFYPTGPILDQGMTNSCVGHAVAQWLVTGPVHNKRNINPFFIYNEAQKIDEWEGQEPEIQGTSIRAAFKVLQNLGYVSKYNWAFDNQTLVDYVLTTGPVIVGTQWSSDMMTPDNKGFIHSTGTIVGGHAYLIKGVNRDYKCPDGSIGAFRLVNSWGLGFGFRGLCWISFNDLQILLREDGEACCSNELLI